MLCGHAQTFASAIGMVVCTHSTFARVNAISASVAALEWRRSFEKLMPTAENRRSTVAEVAGQACTVSARGALMHVDDAIEANQATQP